MQSEEDIISGFEEIFGSEQHKILKDTYVLSPDYLPKQLIGRKMEITELAKIFKPMDFKGYPSNALVLGKSGSGKTVVTKFLLQKLMERLQVNKVLDHPLAWVYIQCKSTRGENGVLYNIIRQIDPDTKIPKKGFAISYYYNALWETIKNKNISVVIVLDEIDYLNGDNLLYNLSRAGEMHELPDRHFITTIGISNRLNYGETLDSRVQSSMQFKNVIFLPYDAEQIKSILCDRVKLAFYEGAIANETIELCAAISAKVHGDARKAIDHLKSAAVYAEEHGFEKVLPDHVDKAFEENDVDQIMTLAVDLPLHDKLVLLAILKNTNYNKPITTASEVTQTYNRLCKEISEQPRHRTTVSNKFGELETLGLIKEGKTRKGRGGQGREIKLDIPSGRTLEELLYQDYKLECLKSFKAGLFNNLFGN